MNSVIYIYHFLDWGDHKTGPAPSQDDLHSIGSGLLSVIKIENGKAYEAHEKGHWEELEDLTKP